MIRKSGTNIIEKIEVPAINASGSDTVDGGVYSLDITHVQASSVDAETALGNVTACATANLRGLLVVSQGIVKAGATGIFLLRGVRSVLVDGTTSVAVGDRLVPQNASPNLIKQASTSLVNTCGLALVAQATAAGTLTQILFDGENWKGEKAAS